MKNRTFRTLMILLLVAVLGAGGVYAAVRYGTQADPLITLSYLTDVKEPELADAYAVKADAAVEELRSTVSGNVAAVTGDYVSVELSDGQTVTCKAGTEVLFRAGSANAAADLSDVTDGSQLEAGQALATNHLYLTRMDGGAVTASGGAALMIRGEYTIG